MTREEVESLGYRNVRQLPDGTREVAVELIFTRAICTGIDWISYAHRWCFEDRELAVSELNKMEKHGRLAARLDRETMTKNKIIRMAREAGIPDPMVFSGACERFAALVAAAERRKISELLGQHSIPVKTLIQIRGAMNLRDG